MYSCDIISEIGQLDGDNVTNVCAANSRLINQLHGYTTSAPDYLHIEKSKILISTPNPIE